MREDSSGDLMTVQAFAEQYRVDQSVVRSWIRHGHIDWVLVGPRKMKRIRRSDAVKPVAATNVRARAVEALIAQGIDRHEAITLVDSMDDDSVHTLVESINGN
jgi:hypothetical protein